MLITGIPGKPPGDWPSSPKMKPTERAEYACHEGNTATRNFIEASRFERGLNPDGSLRTR
jgi:hypothetical protein